MDNNGCYTNNNEYWNGRASSYSDINREELEGESRIRWSELLLGRIGSHFKESELPDIHVLDIGTGPGFFAIILAEAGCKVTAVDMSKEMLAEAIANATIEERQVEAEYEFSFEYPLMNAVMKVVRDMEARVLSQTYDMDVQMRLSIRAGRLEELQTRIKKAIEPY